MRWLILVKGNGVLAESGQKVGRYGRDTQKLVPAQEFPVSAEEEARCVGWSAQFAVIPQMKLPNLLFLQKAIWSNFLDNVLL
jgi:hypothetical protein